MSWSIYLYGHNAGSDGVLNVKLRFYEGMSYNTSYDKTFYLPSYSSSASNCAKHTGLPFGTSTQLVAEIVSMEDNYEFVSWHYTVNASNGYSTSGTKSPNNGIFSLPYSSSYGSSGTLHIWPEAQYVEPEPEPEWRLKTGSISNLSSTYSSSVALTSMTMYRFQFSCKESGAVQIYATGSYDTRAWLSTYSTGFNTSTGFPNASLASDDDSGSGNNFLITYNVTAGTTYNLYVRHYDESSSGTFGLNIIPPATPSEVMVSNMIIGKNPTFSFTRHSSNVYENLYYEFYDLSGTIITNNNYSKYSSWTVPTSFYEKIPNDISGTCSLILETWMDDVLVGTRAYDVSVAIPEDACKPSISPVIKDIKEETLALTGDENIIVKDNSMVEFKLNAVGQNAATIVNTYIESGSHRFDDMDVGVINNPDSGIFTISAVDSRGLITTIEVEKDFIEYFRPTCYQKIKMEMSGEAEVNVSGSLFTDTFGAVENTLKIEVRHTDANGVMGDWVDLGALMPEMGDGVYNFTFTIDGLDYTKPYTFQCRVTDKLYVVESQSYTARWLPVFDWSEDDFNFNVPVNIGADNLDMYDNTVLRYNLNTNNVVLSAGGGHIYIRPGGTSDTSSEIRITAQGNLEIKGDIIINGISIRDKLGI